MAKRLNLLFKKEICGTNNEKEISFYGIGQNSLSDIQELNGIIVDCASFIKKEQITKIYDIGINAMKNKPYSQFIFME